MQLQEWANELSLKPDKSRESEAGATHYFLIRSFAGDALLCERLQELGLAAGQRVEFLGRAPFSGPGVFRTESLTVALRSEEASCVHGIPQWASGATF